MNSSESEPFGTIVTTGQTATVTFDRLLNASIERVWRALTDPEDLAEWLDWTTLEPRVDGRVQIAFDDGPVTGTVTTWDPPHRLEYTWSIEGEPETVVRFQLSTEAEATRLVLEHVRLPGTMGSGYGAGWHAHLDRLKAFIEGASVDSWDDRFAAVLDRYRQLVGRGDAE